MTFNTLDFLLFLPAVFVLYYLLPHKLRNPLLLVANYVFYAAYDTALTLFLVLCTVITYAIGIAVGRSENPKNAKTWTTLGVVLNVGALAFYKYFNFASEMVNSLFGGGKKPFKLDLLVPLGISFIIFQTVSYLIDVYRKKLPAETSLFKFALYTSFFPKLVQGPIERASDMLPQFDEVHHFEHKRFSEGMLMVLYGLFMKMVVADNAAVIVNTVYGNLSGNSGACIALATVMFSLQIYYDFAGYSYTALGAAKLLGFEMKENFRQPYLSSSVAEFWRRWHISLNAWLRDYIYIPLGGNRCSKARKNLNTLITFTISGLWHGANWGYILWGFINGVYINVENAIMSRIKSRKTGEESDMTVSAFFGKLVHRIITFCAIAFAWIFFRAQDLTSSVTAVTRIFKNFNLNVFTNYLTQTFVEGKYENFLGLNVAYGVKALVISMIFVFVVDLLSEKWNLASELANRSRLIRWPVYLILMFAIILFGVYGYGYSAASFIYANF